MKLVNVGRFGLKKIGKILSFIPNNYKLKLARIIPKTSNESIIKLNASFFGEFLKNYRGKTFFIKNFVDKDYNYKLKINFNSSIARQYYFNSYDKKIGPLLKKYLKKDAVFVDVGAAIGQITLMAADFCDNIIAFEPTLDSYFRENMALNNKNIKLFPCALSDHNGEEVINLNENDGISSFESHYKSNSCGTRLITIRKFDDLNIKADFVKIRVQEHEYAVLKGMIKSLKDIKYVYCRLSPSNYRQINKFLAEHSFYPEEETKVLGSVFYKKQIVRS